MAAASKGFRFPLLPWLLLIIVALLMGFGTSDSASDQRECASSLVGLASCLGYVGGTAAGPTPDCCKGLAEVLDKSKKCLCLLIKDRDDPNLGLKMNVTTALTLPASCDSHANITQCIDLLHLPPNSTDAQIFKQFGSTSPAPNTEKGNATGSSSSTGSSNKNSNSGKRVSWVGAELILGFFVCSLTWLL